MTNLEAIKAKVDYPVKDDTVTVHLLDHGLKAEDEYTGKTKDFDLSLADVYGFLATSPNVSEGGYSISQTDKKLLLDMAKGLYASYGVPCPFNPGPSFQNLSNRG